MKILKNNWVLFSIALLLSIPVDASAQRGRIKRGRPERQVVYGFDEREFVTGDEYSAFGNTTMGLFHYLGGSKSLLEHMERQKNKNQLDRGSFKRWLYHQNLLVEKFNEFAKSIKAGRRTNQMPLLLEPFSGYYLKLQPTTCEQESFIVTMDYAAVKELSIIYGDEPTTDYLEIMGSQPYVDGYGCEGQSTYWQRPFEVIGKIEAFLVNHPKWKRYIIEINEKLDVAKRDYERLKKRADSR